MRIARAILKSMAHATMGVPLPLGSVPPTVYAEFPGGTRRVKPFTSYFSVCHMSCCIASLTHSIQFATHHTTPSCHDMSRYHIIAIAIMSHRVTSYRSGPSGGARSGSCPSSCLGTATISKQRRPSCGNDSPDACRRHRYCLVAP